MDIVFFALAFLAGFIVKVVDWMDDEKKATIWFKLPLAFSYGILIGYIIGATTFGLLFLGALLAQVLARKIDTLAHRFGFLVAILSLLYFGFPVIEPLLLLYFMVLAFLDEEDYIGRLRVLAESRPFLKVGALAMVFFGRLDYFIGIALFDMGYVLFSLTSKSIKAKKEKMQYGGRAGVRIKIPIQRKR